MEPANRDVSLGSFTFKEPGSKVFFVSQSCKSFKEAAPNIVHVVLLCFRDLCQGDMSDSERVKTISVSVVPSILEVSSSEWDACCFDATGPEQFNPFTTHGFLSSLEESGCAVKVRDNNLRN